MPLKLRLKPDKLSCPLPFLNKVGQHSRQSLFCKHLNGRLGGCLFLLIETTIRVVDIRGNSVSLNVIEERTFLASDPLSVLSKHCGRILV